MNLRSALRRAGVSFKNKPSDQDEVLICCPFCTDRGESPDTKFRCAINVKKNKGNCKNCDWVASEKAVEEIAKQMHLVTTRTLWSEKEPEPVVEEAPKEYDYGPPEGYFPLAGLRSLPDEDPENLDPISQAIAYAQSRRITWKQIERYAIGACITGKYAYRLIFPIFVPGSILGKKSWRGFVARDFSKTKDRKVLNADCPNYLFNPPPIVGEDDEPVPEVVISEGIIKALAIERVDSRYYSSSIQGHTISEQQLEQLQNSNVILFPDPDPQGLSGFLRLAWTLSTTRRVMFPIHLPNKQADEMNHAEIWTCLNNTQEFNPMLEMSLRVEIGRRRLDKKWK